MWSEDIVTLLVAANVGVSNTSLGIAPRWTIPNGDGPFTMITETGGSGPDETHDHIAQPAFHRPGAQIMVVAKNYVNARATARAAYLALRIRNQMINGIWYRDIRALQEPFPLPLDALFRVPFVFNVVGNKSFS